MKIYCIVEEGWTGYHYVPEDVLCFSTEEKRNEALAKLEQSGSTKKGDTNYSTFETELDAFEL